MNMVKHADVARITVRLRAKFIAHRKYRALEEAIGLLEATRRAEMEAGIVQEAYGVAVVGNPGSGKSTAMGHLFRSHKTLTLLQPDRVQADVASFIVPSPSTLKMVGMSCLTGLGYPLRRDRTAGIIWDLVQHNLQKRQTLLLHLDESQDLMRSRSEHEMNAVISTLKSLMQHRQWPVALALSGLPDLKALLNKDTQLGRRFHPIEFSPLEFETDGKNVARILNDYAQQAGLMVGEHITTENMVRRVIHGGCSELGVIIQLVIGSIQEALLADDEVLADQHFAAAFRRKSACVDDLNPFVREDFSAIDPRLLLTSEEDLITTDETWRRLA